MIALGPSYIQRIRSEEVRRRAMGLSGISGQAISRETEQAYAAPLAEQLEGKHQQFSQYLGEKNLALEQRKMELEKEGYESGKQAGMVKGTMGGAMSGASAGAMTGNPYGIAIGAVVGGILGFASSRK